MLSKLFVIIVTYKGHQWYERCFTSLRGSEYPLQTIVIDNASNDGTVEYIREHYPEVHLIESNENLGFGRANNIGMRYALDHGCDYVFLLNQDAWIEPNTISELVRIHHIYPKYNILSPIHLNADKTYIESGMFSYMKNERITDVSWVQDLYFGRLQEVYESKYINAAGWFIPRNTIEIIGGFCPLIYHYGEDDDYLNRLHYHRMNLGICPSARMVHDKSVCLDNSDSLSKRAILYCIDDFLNINININFYKAKFFLLRQVIKSILRYDRSSMKRNYIIFRYLLKNCNRIELIREQHKLKQANWL